MVEVPQPDPSLRGPIILRLLTTETNWDDLQYQGSYLARCLSNGVGFKVLRPLDFSCVGSNGCLCLSGYVLGHKNSREAPEIRPTSDSSTG